MEHVLQRSDRIFVAGHRGLVGSAITRLLHQQGYTHLLLPTRSELDLTDQQAVRSFFARERPDHVFLAAACVGGILANNTYRADFIYQNLMIATNVVEASYRNQVKRLLFLGSSCIYPKHCAQPMRESELLSGCLEQTNEPYAIAKIAGIKLCDAFNAQYGTQYVSVMPTNLYGPHDNFDLQTSHVLPALLRKFHEAKVNNIPEVMVWGSGKPLREFLHVDDLAAACLFVIDRSDQLEMLNVGSGEEVTIRQLAELVAKVTGFNGTIVFDSSRPDGTPRKLLDSGKLNALGWHPRYTLEAGLRHTYAWFLAHIDALAKRTFA